VKPQRLTCSKSKWYPNESETKKDFQGREDLIDEVYQKLVKENELQALQKSLNAGLLRVLEYDPLASVFGGRQHEDPPQKGLPAIAGPIARRSKFRQVCTTLQR